MRSRESLEERFAFMRERQRELQELRELRALRPATAPPRQRLPSETTLRRKRQVESSLKQMQMYRVKEVALMLGVSRQTVEIWFRSRAVLVGDPKPGKRLRQTILIPRTVFEEWVKEHQAQAS